MPLPSGASTAMPLEADNTVAEFEPSRGVARLWRAGRTSWAVLGVLALAVVLAYVAGRLSLVVVPAILALFPATLLWPLAAWLKRHHVPAALAALGSILTGLLLFAAVIGAMVPLVIAELPALAESAAAGISELGNWLAREPFGLEGGGVDSLLGAVQDQIGSVGDLTPQALAAATTAVETLAGVALLLVLLFFYLKDGSKLGEGIVAVLPERIRDPVRGSAARAWRTLGSYFRWLLVVALIDGVLIGVGLLVLRVPLAVPLAVLVFCGGLFPIVGAIVTGILAVLVALADGGLGMGLAVLAIVLVVQQVESNVLQPVIQSRAVQVHPLVVLLSVTAGGLLLGILGAFLAVPAVAIASRTLRYLRSGDADAQGGAAEPPAGGGEAGEAGSAHACSP